MRWPLVVFMVLFHCLWVYKGRTGVSSRSINLEGVHGTVIPLDLE